MEVSCFCGSDDQQCPLCGDEGICGKADSGATIVVRPQEDGRNPYTIAPFGGMVAYVVDGDAATWSDKIAATVSSAVGNGRTYVRKVGDDDHHVSKHSFQHTSEEGTSDYSVEVIHMAIEIDANPIPAPLRKRPRCGQLMPIVTQPKPAASSVTALWDASRRSIEVNCNLMGEQQQRH